MKSYSAWVEISGKVFVDDWEIADYLGLQGDENDTATDKLSSIDKAEVEAAFEHLAQEKIGNLFPTDDPLKFNEAIIDYKSFK